MHVKQIGLSTSTEAYIQSKVLTKTFESISLEYRRRLSEVFIGPNMLDYSRLTDVQMDGEYNKSESTIKRLNIQTKTKVAPINYLNSLSLYLQYFFIQFYVKLLSQIFLPPISLLTLFY